MSPSKIVITGTIASGKSTVSEILKSLGYLVIDSDAVNRELLEKGASNYEAIKNSHLFDQAFVADKLDKKKLAKIIFADKEKMDALNKISHPNIIKAIDEKLGKCKDKVAFIEIPLFYQMDAEFPTDYVWLVTASEYVQIRRLSQRDDIDKDYAKEKISKQYELIKQKREPDYIIVNDGSVAELEEKLRKILKQEKLLWKL